MSEKTKWEKEYNKDTWSVRCGGLRISVLTGHLNNPDVWVMHCPALLMSEVDLKLPADQPADLAMGMAVNLVRNKLKDLSAALGRIE